MRLPPSPSAVFLWEGPTNSVYLTRPPDGWGVAVQHHRDPDRDVLWPCMTEKEAHERARHLLLAWGVYYQPPEHL